MLRYNSLIKIITMLSDGYFHSYKNIYNKLGITKNNINNEINVLKFFGLNILKVLDKGYMLDQPIQLINKKKISAKLMENNNIFIIPIIDSTNQYLLNNLNKLKLGDICISEYQKKGRGRNGKRWLSPFGYNLYFSVYWVLKNTLNSIIGLSLVVAISIAESLKKLGVHDIQLKWPNDIYLYNKKLAGILIETIENNSSSTKIIIGIGINVSLYAFYENKIKKNFISLQEAKINIDRNIIFSILIKNLKISLYVFESKGLNSFIEKFYKLDSYLNKEVYLIFKNKKISGIYRGIDNKGFLLLEQKNNFTSWNYGHLSLRIR